MAKAKKILIVYVSAAAGHQMAARGLEDVLVRDHPDVDFLNIDALDYTNFIHKKLYAQSYLSIVNYLPSFWGYIYKQLDNKESSKMANSIVSFFDLINAQRLFSLIKEFSPDHIICTHFLASELLHAKRREFKIPNSVVVTDYDVHNFWVYENVNHYFVASPEVKHLLTHKGVSPDKVTVSGIPVRQCFLEKFERAPMQKKWRVNPNRKTILMMSGGFGVGGVKQIVRTLIDLPYHFNLLVVAGKNSKLLDELKKISPTERINYQPLGFVEHIHELMEVADLMVTKAGGLTVTEGLVKGLPMVLADSIPGQEERNADYMMEIGAGAKAHSLVSLESKVSQLLEHAELLDRMHHRAIEAARPNAARQIIEKALALT